MASLPAERRPTPGLLFAVAAPGVIVLAVVLVVWCLLVVGAARRAIGGGLLAAGLVAITVGDLFAFGLGYNPSCSPEYVYPETPAITALKAAGENSRFMAFYRSWPIGRDFPEAVFSPNAATYYGVYDVAGYDSIYLQGYKDSLSQYLDDDPSPAANGNMILVGTFTWEAAQYLGVGQWLARESDIDPWSPSSGTRTARLPRANFRASLLPSSPPIDYGPTEERAGVSIKMMSPNAVDVTVEERIGSSDETLYLRDTWFPGWVAAVNGRVVEPSPMQSGSWRTWEVPLRPGDRRVEFRYEPCAFRFGLFMTLCALGLLAAVGGAVALQRRPR
jgi:hypothetical protein